MPIYRGSALQNVYRGSTELDAYRGSVVVAGPVPFAHTPDMDVDLAPGERPYDIWSDGITLWATGGLQGDPVNAYVLATGARDSSKDFSAFNRFVARSGIWSDGTTIWFGDPGRNDVYAYNLSTRARDAAKDFSPPSHVNVDALWSDGETLWIADSPSVLYAFDLVTKAEIPAKTGTVSSPERRFGINFKDMWSDGVTLWVLDSIRKIYAFSLDGFGRHKSRDFDTLVAAGNTSPEGIWSDGSTMYVSDRNGDKIYTYNMPPPPSQPQAPTNLRQDPDNPINQYTMGLLWDGNADDDAYRIEWTGGGTTQTFVLRSELATDGSEITRTDYLITGLAAGTSYTLTAVAIQGAFESEISDPLTISTVVATPFARYAPLDFTLAEFLAAGPTYTSAGVSLGSVLPRGLWGDSDNFYIVSDEGANRSGQEDQIFYYNRATKARPRFGGDVRLSGNPRGIWSDGTNFYVTYSSGVRAYSLSTRSFVTTVSNLPRLSSAGNTNAWGIWSDGLTWYVTDTTDDKIYAYRFRDGARDADKDFDTLAAAGNTNPVGLWSDGRTMWVAEPNPRKLFAYNLVTKARTPDLDFETLVGRPGLPVAQQLGIWSDGQSMFVVEHGPSIFAYNMPPPPPLVPFARNFSRELGLFSGPFGLWGDGETLFVGFAVRNSYVGAFNLSTGVYDRDRALESSTLRDAGNANPTGLWSDGQTMWVADSRDLRLYAYDLETRAEDSSQELILRSGNTNPSGLWSDGTTMWVVDESDDKIYAYNLSTKARDAAKDFDTLRAAGNTNPTGLWSDGVTMWVADTFDDKIYAYTFSTKARDDTKDFNLLADTGNTNPRGIWSDGVVMLVVDSGVQKIFAYNMP